MFLNFQKVLHPDQGLFGLNFNPGPAVECRNEFLKRFIVPGESSCSQKDALVSNISKDQFIQLDTGQRLICTDTVPASNLKISHKC